MKITPRYKLKYNEKQTDKKFQRRRIRKTNKVLTRMHSDALMLTVQKTNRHISIIVFDSYYNKLAIYSTTQYIDAKSKNNKNYCNISYANKIAQDSVEKIKQLKQFNNKIVFNSGPYKYHGKIKTIDTIIKEKLATN